MVCTGSEPGIVEGPNFVGIQIDSVAHGILVIRLSQQAPTCGRHGRLQACCERRMELQVSCTQEGEQGHGMPGHRWN